MTRMIIQCHDNVLKLIFRKSLSKNQRKDIREFCKNWKDEIMSCLTLLECMYDVKWKINE